MLIQLILNGFTLGSIYALTALGLVIVYRSISVINFAQGDFVMLGAFFGVLGTLYLGLPLWVTFFLSCALSVVVGYLSELMTWRPLKDKSFLPFVVTTMAFGIILDTLVGKITKFEPLKLDSFFGTKVITVFGASLSMQNLFIVAITAVLILGISYLFSKTRIGILMQASAQNPEVARLMGVKVEQMRLITFCINGFLAGFAGLLLAPLFFVTATMGMSLIMKAFAATVIGGFGNEKGAIVGGIFIGVVEALSAAYISSGYVDAIVFSLLILTLIFLPQGFLGEKISERV